MCKRTFITTGLSVLLAVIFFAAPAFAQEDPLWVIYNTVYGGSYVTSNADLESTYGVAGDEVFLETNGYVEASARFAGYTQRFGYYTDLCVGSNMVELFNVTTTGYLSGYTATFLVGGGTTVIGLYTDPSGSPTWFSQPVLNSDGQDHMRTFRAPDYDPLNPEYLIAWEDLENLGDGDYNDLVLVIRYLEPYAVTCCDSDDDCADDGLYCNGNEICVDNVCTHSGNPCGALACDEEDSYWFDGSCVLDPPVTYRFDFNGDQVWDMEWCLDPGETQDVEIWVADYSLPANMYGTAFFVAYDTSVLQINVANSYVYDTNHGGPWHPYWTMLEEVGGVRIEIHAADFLSGGVPVPDGKIKIALLQLERIGGGDGQIETEDGIVIDNNPLFYVPSDATALIKDCSALDDQCNVGVCDPVSGECVQDPVPKNGLPCDDGLFCNGTEVCNLGVCETQPETEPCLPPYLCDEDNDQCVLADVIVEPGDVWYNPNGAGGVTVKKPVCLDNPEVLVGGLQFDLCEYNADEEQVDCMECIACELSERTTMFDCAVLELPNGCCRVLLFCKNPGCAINPGVCNIATVVYKTFPTSPECPWNECITQVPENIIASDYNGYQLTAVGLAGTVCPFFCGDVCPPDNPSVTGWDCGDSVVDIYDIMCEVDFALTSGTPDDCQAVRADVPTGTPPNCIAPDGKIDILDVMVIIDMALNRQDCCSFYYQGIIY